MSVPGVGGGRIRAGRWLPEPGSVRWPPVPCPLRSVSSGPGDDRSGHRSAEVEPGCHVAGEVGTRHDPRSSCLLGHPFEGGGWAFGEQIGKRSRCRPRDGGMLGGIAWIWSRLGEAAFHAWASTVIARLPVPCRDRRVVHRNAHQRIGACGAGWVDRPSGDEFQAELHPGLGRRTVGPALELGGPRAWLLGQPAQLRDLGVCGR
jgi:hypothetical protein